MQASLLTDKAGLFRVEGIEDDSLPGIERRDLHRRAAAHRANGHVIVEIDGARITRRDPVGLETSLRKDQQLRIGIYVETVEQAA